MLSLFYTIGILARLLFGWCLGKYSRRYAALHPRVITIWWATVLLFWEGDESVLSFVPTLMCKLVAVGLVMFLIFWIVYRCVQMRIRRYLGLVSMDLMMQPTKRCIAVEGNIGSGKTTWLKSLSTDRRVHVFEEKVNAKLLSIFYQNPDSFAFPFQICMMYERLQWTIRYLPQPDTTLVMDRFMLGDVVFCTKQYLDGRIYTSEFKRYQEVIRGQLRKHVGSIWYLFNTAEESYENILRRGTIERDIVPLAYLEDIHLLHMYFIMALMVHAPDIPIQVFRARYQTNNDGTFCLNHLPCTGTEVDLFFELMEKERSSIEDIEVTELKTSNVIMCHDRFPALTGLNRPIHKRSDLESFFFQLSKKTESAPKVRRLVDIVIRGPSLFCLVDEIVRDLLLD